MWRGIVLTRNQALARATAEISAAAGQALRRISRLNVPIGLSRRMGMLVRPLRLALPMAARLIAMDRCHSRRRLRADPSSCRISATFTGIFDQHLHWITLTGPSG